MNTWNGKKLNREKGYHYHIPSRNLERSFRPLGCKVSPAFVDQKKVVMFEDSIKPESKAMSKTEILQRKIDRLQRKVAIQIAESKMSRVQLLQRETVRLKEANHDINCPMIKAKGRILGSTGCSHSIARYTRGKV